MGTDAFSQAAAEFNAVYVELSALHRRLVATVSSGVDEADPAAHELLAEAQAVTAALRAAPDAPVNGSPGAAEARALRALVMRPPLDGHLLMAAFRAQPPAQAFPLAADALEAVAGASAPAADVWGERMVVDLLGAPRGMDLAAARRIAGEIGLNAHTAVAALAEDERARLVAALRDGDLR